MARAGFADSLGAERLEATLGSRRHTIYEITLGMRFLRMHLRMLLNAAHKSLSRSRVAVRLAVLLRNQCRCVIRCHISDDADPWKNGEAGLVGLIAPTSSHFIDVGANTGSWTSLFLASAAASLRGLLFEPSQCAAEKLVQRFQTTPGVEVIRAAVADAPGDLPFYEEPGAGETSSLVTGFSQPGAVKKMIPVTTLDAEIDRRQWRQVDLLKIDAEGYDLRVLRGASAALSRQAIGVVQFEYNTPWAAAGCTLADAFRFLESFGYQVFLLRADGLFRLNYGLYGEYFDYSNFVAVAPCRQAKMEAFVRGPL
jgi:FkbM family methyltransferase